MASLRWTADGIEVARRAGGLDLEVYRRPGFTGGPGVRAIRDVAGGSGLELELIVDPGTDDQRRSGCKPRLHRRPRP